MWKPPKRNFDNIQFEKYRKVVDNKFNDLADELSDCYYNYWKLGNSKPFQKYDVQPTLEESKALFNKIHGLIWLKHEEAIEQEHNNTPESKKNTQFTNKLQEKSNKDVDFIKQRNQQILKFENEGIKVFV